MEAQKGELLALGLRELLTVDRSGADKSGRLYLRREIPGAWLFEQPDSIPLHPHLIHAELFPPSFWNEVRPGSKSPNHR